MKFKKSVFILLAFSVSVLHAQQKNNYHTFLGVDINTMSGYNNGLFVNGVYKGYGAKTAGLLPGDLLQAVNGKRVRSFNELVNTLDEYKPGEHVEISFIRNNSTQTVKVSLSEYPEFLKYNSSDFYEGRTRKPRATLGVHTESMWEQYALLVTGFTENSAARKAGLQVGDVLLKMDDYEFVAIEELKYYLSKYKPSDDVTLTIKRDGQQKMLKVGLGEDLKYKNETKDKEKQVMKEMKEK